MKKFIYLLMLSFAMLGCKKEDMPDQIEGNYAGTFSVVTGNDKVVSDFAIILSRNRFTVTKGGVSRGPYEVPKNGEIKFQDEQLYTSYLDLSTRLIGNYQYKIDGDSLIITKNIPSATNYYQYRLKRISIPL